MHGLSGLRARRNHWRPELLLNPRTDDAQCSNPIFICKHLRLDPLHRPARPVHPDQHGNPLWFLAIFGACSTMAGGCRERMGLPGGTPAFSTTPANPGDSVPGLHRRQRRYHENCRGCRPLSAHRVFGKHTIQNRNPGKCVYSLYTHRRHGFTHKINRHNQINNESPDKTRIILNVNLLYIMHYGKRRRFRKTTSQSIGDIQ